MTKSRRALAAVSVPVAAVLAGCGPVSSSSQSAPPAAATVPAAARSAAASATHRATAAKAPRATTAPRPTATHAADPSGACDNRPPASGDIYVRFIAPGSPWEAQELGGEWRWDSTTSKCLTSVQLQIAAAPLIAGACTQVGYVKDNPGYNVNGTPAPPLKVVTAAAGPAC